MFHRFGSTIRIEYNIDGSIKKKSWYNIVYIEDDNIVNIKYYKNNKLIYG